jgi:hypothetical protein
MRAASAAWGGRIDHYPFLLSAEAQRLGRTMQSRFGSQVGPGVLCARSGYAEFFPTKRKDARLAWSDSVHALQLKSFAGSSCVLRVHGPNGSHQLATNNTVKQVEEGLDGLLRIVDGWTVEDPTL